jgi:hypothetical protein
MKKLIMVLLFVCMSATAEVVAIISTAVKIGHITRTEARSLYLMKERRWDDGQLVVIVQMTPGTRIHKAFVRDVLNMTNEQYTREWDRMVNAGLSTRIKIVANQDEMFNLVSSTPNAIGYLDQENLLVNTGKADIRTLKIID